jgi:hypothetical protein
MAGVILDAIIHVDSHNDIRKRAKRLKLMRALFLPADLKFAAVRALAQTALGAGRD